MGWGWGEGGFSGGRCNAERNAVGGGGWLWL